ncbi:ATP-dependent RNA helicase MRH4, mitochondrial [Candida albicans L26]|nr:ATP-dependent RNA helicase MRH4, mitochondrial [Candida albicans P37005]KGT66103.1 ATP-dependent RNA helicase MRH4, mitochondrial [Candida albicans 12C]KGU05526.1 ATP-dependent RNA helicase MRH4, mitochondrial [Candida albicans 19F]KGU06000.1 ATP-dependent RNA helicase MRH4, mitochondrial [Candida albicans L26]KHC50406.1 ATP-dependent RNA helicase MRH4, mitochondrial [Candida albicans P37039]
MFKLLIPNKYNYVIRPLVRFKSIKSPKSPKPKPKPTAKLSPNVFSSGKFSQLHNDTSTTNIESKITSFDQLKIFPSVREAMIKEIKSQYNLKGPRHSNIDEIDIKPTPVQIAAIRKINQTRKLKVPNKDLEGMDDAERIQFELQNANEIQKTKVFTVAAETGSGKTWSYLAPLLSKLKSDDMEFWKSDPEGYDNTRKKGQFVKSVILLPTNELVDQVYETLQRANSFELDHKGAPGNFTSFLELPENKTMNITTMKLGQGEAPVRLFRQLETKGPIDVLITTPGKIVAFSKLVNINRPFRVFANVKYCVLDEADTLFDDSFEKNTTDVITHFPKLLDLILVSATIPKVFEKKLSKLFPDQRSLIRVATPSLHKVPRNIKVMTIDADVAPYNGSKPRCLAQALYAISKDGTEPGYVKRIIVFVNEKSEVDGIVESMITKYKVRPEDIVGVSGSVNIRDRKDMLQPFLQPAELIENDDFGSKVKILVTTDLLARGLNFQGVKNVILLGLPRNSVDLVHRLGRTGRMNQNGRVFVIVDKKSKKSWVKGLGNAIIRGLRIG